MQVEGQQIYVFLYPRHGKVNVVNVFHKEELTLPMKAENNVFKPKASINA